MRPCQALVLAAAGVLACGRDAGNGDRSPGHVPIADRIVTALAPDSGETAILRYDPEGRPDIRSDLARALAARGVTVRDVAYGPVEGFEALVAGADIYVALPDPPPTGTDEAQRAVLAAWLDAGRGREIHFHWGAGTVDPDGLAGVHSPAFDSVYIRALNIDYDALDADQRWAIDVLRSDTVRVTTAGGTDLRLFLDARPVNRQNGDASPARMADAVIRVDREIELPAGVVRVAPVEASVQGRLVIPRSRWGEDVVEGLTLEINAGRVTNWQAERGGEAFGRAVDAAPALASFRELGIGFNPALIAPPGSPWLPYYGYGAGVVRLSLGNNRELGGNVDGEGVRWFFFPAATVRVGSVTLVQDGRLQVAH